MARADGVLSAIQFEIMQIVWESDPQGVSIGEIWQTLGTKRKVVRSTIQNMVERLAADGWLKRRTLKAGIRFRAAVAREEVQQQLTQDFVENFFGGSASQLVMNILGGQEISREEVRQLQQLLKRASDTGVREE